MSVAAGQTAPQLIDYSSQVHPVLAARCLSCHSQERRSGGLSLGTYKDVLDGGRSGATVKPGSSASSILVHRITGESEPRMPLGTAPLSPSEIAVIRNWIDQGARPASNAAAAKGKWEPKMALAKPALPQSPWAAWSSPLDRLTAAYLASHGVAEPQLISDSRFARRASLDISGLLPSPEEQKEFLANPKREEFVQRLLGDNTKYSEHWISFWNDLLRNDQGVSYYSETASRKSITKWLLGALESNLAFDKFVSALLNPVDPSDPDGFLIGVNWRGTVSASQTPALQAAQNTAQIFLGVNLKCNSCHDSFISRWKLKDAYSLAAYFSAEEKLELYRCDVAQKKYASAEFLFPELNRPIASLDAADRRAAAAAIFTDPRNGRMPRTIVNRIWERLMGRGIVENVDEMDGEPWSPEVLDWLAADFVEHGYDLKHLIATVVTSRAYQLASVPQTAGTPKEYVFRGPEVRRLTAEEFADAVASITGDWHVAPPVTPPSSNTPPRGPLVISGAPNDAAGVAAPKPQQTKQPPVQSTTIAAGTYTREWRVAASSLTRSLGRPVRDQVYSTRDQQATTIQAVELVNGEALTHWLARGSRRMLGQLPPEPKSLLSRALNGSQRGVVPYSFDVDISHSRKLYLVVQDALSTAPDKAAPYWTDMQLEGPNGTTPLSKLLPLDSAGLREPASGGTLKVKLSSVLAYDIAGKGFTRLKGTMALEESALNQGETVLARFFLFDEQPSLDHLVPPHPETPLPAPPAVTNMRDAVDCVFHYALGRDPSPQERKLAETALANSAHPGHPSPEGMADLLWAVLMKPEFQLIY